MKLGIIGAMDVEVATLKEIMQNKTEKVIAGSVCCEGISCVFQYIFLMNESAKNNI